VRFFMRELEPMLDEVRSALGKLLAADPDDLALVTNATTGVNTVLRSLRFEAGDEILVTDHGYAACNNASQAVSERAGAQVVVAEVPFPIASEAQVLEAVLARASARTRLALLDHITSPTGLIFPVERIVAALRERGIDTLIDGAHAPGMVSLDLERVGAAYYTGNCHKWLCAPKGAAFLHVRRDRQIGMRPLVISHGAGSRRTDRSRFRLEFDWTGTDDPTAWLCVPEAIRFLEVRVPGGLPALMRRNRELALAARAKLAAALEVAPPAPDRMIGTLVSMPLRDGEGEAWSPSIVDPLHDALFSRFQIEVPVFSWPRPPKRLIRISAQLYNRIEDYERLAQALVELGPPWV
jgi:isopenicillin-N epimerase